MLCFISATDIVNKANIRKVHYSYSYITQCVVLLVSAAQTFISAY